jgi:hypothetical protein
MLVVGLEIWGLFDPDKQDLYILLPQAVPLKSASERKLDCAVLA